jgi:hypothetical protein
MNAHDVNATEIGRRLAISPRTVRNILHHIEKNQALHGTRGRPKKRGALSALVEAIRLSVSSNPLQSLLESRKAACLGPAAVMRIRHLSGFLYYQTIPIPLLRPEHIRKRNEFAPGVTREMAIVKRPLIVTDESTFVQVLKCGGIWRDRDLFEPIDTDKE